MKDQAKTKQVLIQETTSLRQRIQELEQSESGLNRAKESLREREEKLLMALYGAEMGMWDLDISTQSGTIDERAAQILGYQKDEIPTQIHAWDEMTHPDDVPLIKESIKAHLEGRKPIFQTDHRMRMATGEWKWVHGRGKITKSHKDGSPIRISGTIHDISDRKQMEVVLQESHTKLARNLKDAIDVISETIEAKGPYAPGHHRHVAALTSAIAREMGLSDFQVQGIELAAAVYDIGLITIPIEFLQDSERLDGIKLTLYQGYPQTGHDALKKIEFPWPIAEIILQHRECFDGSGFPHGIREEKILIEARILAVVIALKDLTTHKSFRNAFPLDKALDDVSSHSGSKYDPDVVAACLKLFKGKGYKMES
jgi:PAS domain S-box-containing protein